LGPPEGPTVPKENYGYFQAATFSIAVMGHLLQIIGAPDKKNFVWTAKIS